MIIIKRTSQGDVAVQNKLTYSKARYDVPVAHNHRGENPEHGVRLVNANGGRLAPNSRLSQKEASISSCRIRVTIVGTRGR